MFPTSSNSGHRFSQNHAEDRSFLTPLQPRKNGFPRILQGIQSQTRVEFLSRFGFFERDRAAEVVAPTARLVLDRIAGKKESDPPGKPFWQKVFTYVAIYQNGQSNANGKGTPLSGMCHSQWSRS